MVDTMIPSEVYASLASQLDAAAHEAVSKGDDSCHVDLDVEFPMANGDTLFANLKGSSLLTWTRFRTPEGMSTEISRIYPNWWEFGASASDEDLDNTDFSINTLLDMVPIS